MLQHLAARPQPARRFATRALILAPTRELALQTEAELHRFGDGRNRVVAILGGVSRSMQVQRMPRRSTSWSARLGASAT